eukprot:TRINITY_DN4523_c0_g2_i2.p1 TRINITY_DN4523_c0_g2~~TRINITY_DN4523_c0_g2_i2.p1  ORF type:complete len:302 (+),score=72.25 TRINITY_DN4523_c0_g2_i2:75-980(+)
MKRKRGGSKGGTGRRKGKKGGPKQNQPAAPPRPKQRPQPSMEDSYSSSEEEEVNAYDMLLHSLGVEKERESGALSSSSEEGADVGDFGAVRNDDASSATASSGSSNSSISRKNKGKKRRRRDSSNGHDEASSRSSSSSNSSSSSSSSTSGSSGQSAESSSSASMAERREGVTDPFFVHFSRNVSPEEVMTAHTSTANAGSSKFSHPMLGPGVLLRPPVITSQEEGHASAHVKSRLRQHVLGMAGCAQGGKSSLNNVLSPQEMALLTELGTYKNIALTQRPVDSNDGYLRPYAIHVLNHVLK